MADIERTPYWLDADGRRLGRGSRVAARKRGSMSFGVHPCICGCGQRAAAKHHVIYQQEVRRCWRDKAGRGARSIPPLTKLLRDERNLVPMALVCHSLHHSGSRKLALLKLPDGAFEFAAWLMGRGPAFNYLGQSYAGSDPRLAALLEEVVATV